MLDRDLDRIVGGDGGGIVDVKSRACILQSASIGDLVAFVESEDQALRGCIGHHVFSTVSKSRKDF